MEVLQCILLFNCKKPSSASQIHLPQSPQQALVQGNGSISWPLQCFPQQPTVHGNGSPSMPNGPIPGKGEPIPPPNPPIPLPNPPIPPPNPPNPPNPNCGFGFGEGLGDGLGSGEALTTRTRNAITRKRRPEDIMMECQDQMSRSVAETLLQ